MKKISRITSTLIVLASASVCSLSAMGQDISGDKITALDTKLTEAGEAASSARKKLALRRVIRETETLLKKSPAAPNRFEVLDVLFRSQQTLLSLDNSATNRKDFLETCEKLAAAPNEYAALRLDADLLLTQAKSARLGGDSHARSDALRPLVERYQDTEVEPKVIQIAMIMALEFGNTELVNDLREVIAVRLPDNLDLINFQSEKLAGQVFGAPFIGTFQRGSDKTAQFPMDFLGTTTLLYCWSKEDNGEEDLKALAAAWKKAKVEHQGAGRFQIVSMNMDDLPDAGESIIRGLGIDWHALAMPKGKDSPIYQTYVKNDTPTVVTVSPTGYVAMVQSGGGSSKGNYEKRLQSMMSRSWALPRYSSQLQSFLAGEFLITPSAEDFDPSAPPEYKAITSDQPNLPRTAESVPEDTLRAIQACFINPPMRYRTPHEQLIANFKKADELSRAAISAHPNALDLWIVRNRRITALISLWKTNGDQEAFSAAVTEANALLKSSYPAGTDVVARLCLAREALRAPDADSKMIIKDFIETSGGQQASGPALAAASLLALDTGNRLLHDQYRRAFLDKHANDQTMWNATAYMLNRYQRYWMFHPPFSAGWTYGRRQGHFLSIGNPEEAKRTFKAEFKTIDGETVKIPESSEGKWTVISFIPTATGNGYIPRFSAPVMERPFNDVNLIAAVLDDDTDVARKLLEEKKKPETFPTLLVPGGLNNPLVRKLGILAEDTRPNILLLRPDGSIAAALSGLTMSSQKGYIIQNVIEYHDEQMVDAALAKGDLEEAKRLAFAYAPVEVPTPDAKKKPKPVKISVPHLRSRAKVYLAMGEYESALADAEEAYLAVNIAAGYISMRTDELKQAEALKSSILAAKEKQ